MQSTINRLQASSSPLDICGLQGASHALFLAQAAEALQAPLCCVLPADTGLEQLAEDIRFFSQVPVWIFPSLELTPYTPLSPDPHITGKRLATLYQVMNSMGPMVVLTSVEAILRRLIPKKMLDHGSELLMITEDVDREELVARLIHQGYQLSDMVKQPGEIAQRGGILDIFPPLLDSEGPLRFDFFGDTVESIKVFDPVTQRSLKGKDEVEEAIILPASDLLFPQRTTAQWRERIAAAATSHSWSSEQEYMLVDQISTGQRFPGLELLLPLLCEDDLKPASLFSFLPDNTRLIVLDPPAIRQKTDLLRERQEANYAEVIEKGDQAVFPPDALFLTAREEEEAWQKNGLARLCQLPDPEATYPPLTIKTGSHNLLKQEIELHRQRRGLFAPVMDRVEPWLEEQETIILTCQSDKQGRHFQEILKNYQLHGQQIMLDQVHKAFLSPDPQKALSASADSVDPGRPNSFLLVEHPLSQGFDLPEHGLHILSAGELFGEKRLIRDKKSTRRPQGEPVQIDTLNAGDVVVHRDHGVGIFQELINMEFSGLRGDFMLITFKGDDKLYVPVDRLHWISRYQGLTDQQPALDSLGSQKWQTTKKKVTDAVWKVAHELLDIYAQRALRKGHRFDPPGEWYEQMEESFPYEETPGQQQAITAILNDLTSEQPMDRLVCGDVGYGKTEVAARAAFKVIEDGLQVALLVPTTVLAEQHAATFRARLAGFPVSIACLNRFRTSAEKRKIRADLGQGKIDIIVGTHALLAKDIQFSHLGLLIVDEEHRFGVSHKEKIKKIKAEVDVLTLTATPIPRTLQMSLLGIRDLSVISTPPRKRQAVKTYLARRDQLVIKEAVLRELQRGGQLFFVHNRVRSIHRIAEEINELVPQARISVAHGQMPGKQLEEIMVDFINHKTDVLVCTTIIESGLDIPNANTIIINRADHLGLADIYQLRGRVGRSSAQAYAYLLVPSLDHLSKDAKQRLRALMDNADLGAGFKLAMNDLQIRGGGNLLGVSQSGHIAAVGYDLYLELLQATVKDLKQRAAQGTDACTTLDIDPEVNLKLTAYIPDQYIPDTAQRYQMYRRIAAAGAGTEEQLDDLYDELVDRYGPIPDEALALVEIIRLKIQLRPLGIYKLEQGPNNLILSFDERSPVSPEKMVSFIATRPRLRLTTDMRLVVALLKSESQFTCIREVLSALAEPNHSKTSR